MVWPKTTQATDCALMVINAQYGLEVDIINQFRYTRKFQSQLIYIINQLDHEKVDFDSRAQPQERLHGTKVVAVQFPVNSGTGFNQVVDVLKMKLSHQ